MPEPAIIDTTIIQVKSTTRDQYGNLIVTPMEGDDFRVKESRKHLFDLFQQGNFVKVFWAEYMHKKYVARAELEQQAPPGEKQKPVPPFIEKGDGKPIIAPQEKGMWWKEVGECFRTGLFKKDDGGAGAYLWRTYVKQMLSSLEITIPKQEVQPSKSKLVQEVEKLGVVET